MSDNGMSHHLHSSWTRRVSSFDSSDMKAGSPTIQGEYLHHFQKIILTDVHGQTTNGGQEDLNVGPSNEFGVHPSSILE
jgi:hypothetical protein